MPKKYIVFLKTIGRSWFIILIIVILIVAIFNIIAAIVITIITIVLFILSYIPSLFFKNRLIKSLNKYYRIKEKDIFKEIDNDKEKVRKSLFELSQNQKDKGWLIIFLNNQYIFYHEDVLDKFIMYYTKGYGEKELFESLKKIEVESRAEIKGIIETLKRNNRIPQQSDDGDTNTDLK